jgi:hypothetical protein
MHCDGRTKGAKMKNPTFQEFVDEAFMAIFNGLITGGTKEMKSQVFMYIQTAAWIASNGGFTKPEST